MRIYDVAARLRESGGCVKGARKNGKPAGKRLV